MQTMPDCAPLGILGGTFDPVHHGHLRLAEEARLALGLSKVLWIPAGQPAHRRAPRAAAQHRLQMVRLATAGNPGFRVDATEVDSALAHAQPSYTVPTLRRLRAEYGQQPLVLLLGADAFLALDTWYCWQELFALAHLGVATRPGATLDVEHMRPVLAAEFTQRIAQSAPELQAAPAGRILPFALTPLDISATQLRATLATGGSVRYLLPDPVLDYIRAHQLYSSQSTPNGHS